MSRVFNVYCDESCHLEHDHQGVMILGAVWCPLDKTREIALDLRQIKVDHGLKPDFEIKWTKVSPAKIQFYEKVIDYFFDQQDLHFRALIVPDKSKLEHEAFGQNHDDWYFKMYFTMLKAVLSPEDHYRIYLDIKDSRSAQKVAKLHEVLSNSMYDFSRDIVERIQTVHSHEAEQLQLADLLIGAVSYVNRGLTTSPAKRSLIERIQKRSGYRLTLTTLLREEKVNIFRWDPKEVTE